MSLANGESIYMSKEMTIILETEDLRNTTPATISRCGLVFMESEKYVKPKQILNAWLRYLPSTL